MSGLLRNLLTLLFALPGRGTLAPLDTAVAWFTVTPFDVGVATLKSDKVLQFAESAQVDWMVKTGLAARQRRERWAFVNAAQQVRFLRPIRLFDRVRVESRVVFADARCAWFVHSLQVRGNAHAQVVVKMKFKRGRLTVPPAEVLGAATAGAPAWLLAWDEAIKLAP